MSLFNKNNLRDIVTHGIDLGGSLLGGGLGFLAGGPVGATVGAGLFGGAGGLLEGGTSEQTVNNEFNSTVKPYAEDAFAALSATSAPTVLIQAKHLRLKVRTLLEVRMP